MNNILNTVAQMNEVSVEEVNREIELALNYVRSSSSPEAKQFLEHMPCVEDTPNTQEAISFLAELVLSQLV